MLSDSSHRPTCSQLGDDLRNTQKVLAGLLRHPNAGGVLVLGLGCENNQMDELLALAGDMDRERLGFFNTQDVVDEGEEGVDAVAEAGGADGGRRTRRLSRFGTNPGPQVRRLGRVQRDHGQPLVGRIADRMTAMGGGVILTELPEMFGAEQVLMNRAPDEGVFGDVVAMVNDFEEYFLRHDQPVYENPSPGNKAGGLSLLEAPGTTAYRRRRWWPAVRRCCCSPPAAARPWAFPCRR